MLIILPLHIDFLKINNFAKNTYSYVKFSENKWLFEKNISSITLRTSHGNIIKNCMHLTVDVDNNGKTYLYTITTRSHKSLFSKWNFHTQLLLFRININLQMISIKMKYFPWVLNMYSLNITNYVFFYSKLQYELIWNG